MNRDDRDILQETWNKTPEEPEMTMAQIEARLQPHIRRSRSRWNYLAWVYLAFLAGTLVCEGMALYAFRSNAPVLALGITLTLLTVGFLVYGIQLFRRLTELDLADESLVDRIRHRLEFHRKRYEIWLWMVALSFVFLSLSVSTLADVEDGHYQINKPAVFFGISLAQLLFGYVALKISHWPILKQTRAILSDLENQVLTGTEQVQQQRKVWLIWGVILAVVLTGFLIWGVLRAQG